MAEDQIIKEEKRNGTKLNVITTLCIVMIGYLCTGVWWASGMEQKVKDQTEDRINKTEALAIVETVRINTKHNKEQIDELKQTIVRELAIIRGDLKDIKAMQRAKTN